MAVAYFCQWGQVPEGTADRVGERVSQRLGKGQGPVGGIYHAEGATEDGGWWSFDVWESADAYQDFARQIFYPVLDEVGTPHPQVRHLQVAWDTSQPMTGD